MQKTPEGYAAGPDNVRTAVVLSPASGLPESEAVQQARVMAAEQISEQITRGVPVVIVFEDERGRATFHGAVPTHNGLSVTLRTDEPEHRLAVGVNDFGIPVEIAWQVDDNDIDSRKSTDSDHVTEVYTEPCFDVYAGEKAGQVLAQYCYWNVAAVTPNSESPAGTESGPSTLGLTTDMRGYEVSDHLAMQTVVSAIHAARAINVPITNEAKLFQTRAKVRDHLYDLNLGHDREDKLSAMQHVGEAMRYLYPKGPEGDKAMVDDLVAASRQVASRAFSLKPSLHAPIIQVAIQVCGADQIEFWQRIRRPFDGRI
jgi:hypothetical protein